MEETLELDMERKKISYNREDARNWSRNDKIQN